MAIRTWQNVPEEPGSSYLLSLLSVRLGGGSICQSLPYSFLESVTFLCNDQRRWNFKAMSHTLLVPFKSRLKLWLNTVSTVLSFLKCWSCLILSIIFDEWYRLTRRGLHVSQHSPKKSWDNTETVVLWLIVLTFVFVGRKVSDAAKEVTDFLNDAVGTLDRIEDSTFLPTHEWNSLPSILNM